MTTPSNHLTFDELDAVRTNEGTDAQARHLESCIACQTALAEVQVIAAALRANQNSVTIPDEVDQHVLWLARKQAASIKRSWRGSPGARWAVAASVLVALGVTGIWRSVSTPSLRVAQTASVGNDVNGDGRIDILDAFALARTIQTHPDATAQWDTDGDGAVDRNDVDLIARLAVALGKS